MATEILSGYQIDGTTIVTLTGNIITLNLANANTWTAVQTFKGGIANAAPQNTLTGTTAGSIVYSMPEQGSSYKKFIAYANGYENDTTTAQTITFPTAFTEPPVITTNTTGLTLSASTTTLTINAPDSTTTFTGFIIIDGY